MPWVFPFVTANSETFRYLAEEGMLLLDYLLQETGLEYPLNAYRASWKMAGYPLGERLRDKNHSWGAVQQLIPDAIAARIGTPLSVRIWSAAG